MKRRVALVWLGWDKAFVAGDGGGVGRGPRWSIERRLILEKEVQDDVKILRMCLETGSLLVSLVSKSLTSQRHPIRDDSQPFLPSLTGSCCFTHVAAHSLAIG